MIEKIKLKTEISAREPPEKFTYDTIITGAGSCFARDILGHFAELGFDVTINPNGIVYNSHSIAHALERCVEDIPYSENDFFEYNGLWHSWEHHGEFSSSDLEKAVSKAEKARMGFRDKLSRGGLCVLTPSSSVVYEYSPEKVITANCHKVPGREFKRRMLTVTENLNNLRRSVEMINGFNPGCFVVFTVSPVRHYPGDLILNTRSKASLTVALNECLEEFPGAMYFPSYEIMLDELRDYRFYKDDMLHPSGLARKIIFDRFLETFFSEEAIRQAAKAFRELKRKYHRPGK